MQDGELITLSQPVRCRTGLHLPLQNERRTGLAGERTNSAGSSQQVFPREFAQVPSSVQKKKKKAAAREKHTSKYDFFHHRPAINK